MTLDHVQPRGNRKVYRRRVSKELQPILGKKEIILKLGSTDAEVRKRYDAVHSDAEQILAKAWDEFHGSSLFFPASQRVNYSTKQLIGCAHLASTPIGPQVVTVGLMTSTP